MVLGFRLSLMRKINKLTLEFAFKFSLKPIVSEFTTEISDRTLVLDQS